MPPPPNFATGKSPLIIALRVDCGLLAGIILLSFIQHIAAPLFSTVTSLLGVVAGILWFLFAAGITCLIFRITENLIALLRSDPRPALDVAKSLLAVEVLAGVAATYQFDGLLQVASFLLAAAALFALLLTYRLSARP